VSTVQSLSQVNGVIASLLEGLGDGCLLIDDAHRVVYANGQAKELFAIPEQRRHVQLADIVPEPMMMALVQKAQSAGATLEREFLIKVNTERGQEERYVAMNVSPVQWRKVGNPYLRVLLRDQTERHATEQVRKDFVTNASHELRTPLSIINGYLENLEDGLVDEPGQLKRCLHTMRKHGERIAMIVEDMLTLSKFESATDGSSVENLRAQTFSLRECTMDVVERLQPMIEAKQAEVNLHFMPDAEMIAGDRFYWDQILFNLMENALKENAPGIVIAVKGRREEDTVVLQVVDYGVGIPQEDLAFVFKRFYRVAKHHSSTIKGTGLGLSIVKRAVEAHGGTIGVESALGVSTAFTIRLPDPSTEE
jgi:two-component system phosphate regulon sensor histidine kinase PhoR